MESQKNNGFLTVERLFFLGRKCNNYSVLNQSLKIKPTCTNCRLPMIGYCNPYQQYLCLQKTGTTTIEDKTADLSTFCDRQGIQLGNQCIKFQVFNEKVIRKCSNCKHALYGECNPSKTNIASNRKNKHNAIMPKKVANESKRKEKDFLANNRKNNAISNSVERPMTSYGKCTTDGQCNPTTKIMSVIKQNKIIKQHNKRNGKKTHEKMGSLGCFRSARVHHWSG